MGLWLTWLSEVLLSPESFFLRLFGLFKGKSTRKRLGNSENLLCIENVRSSELETSESAAPAHFPRSNQVNLAEASELRN